MKLANQQRVRIVASISMMALVSVALNGCGKIAANSSEVSTAAPYEGEWHTCLSAGLGVYINIVDGKLHQGYTHYAGNDCSTGGTYTLSSDTGGSTPISAIEYASDLTTKTVSGVADDFLVARNTVVGGATVMDIIMYFVGDTDFYQLVPTSGTYSGGQATASHTTWSAWLSSETEVSGFAAAPTTYSSGGFFVMHFTKGAP